MGEVGNALLAVSAAGFALMGIMLGAVALLPGAITGEYLIMIERTPHGMPGVLRSYKIVAWVSFGASSSGLLGGVAWPALKSAPEWSRGLVAAVPSFFVLWAALGSLKLIGQSLFHFESRAELKRQIKVVRDRKRSVS